MCGRGKEQVDPCHIGDASDLEQTGLRIKANESVAFSATVYYFRRTFLTRPKSLGEKVGEDTLGTFELCLYEADGPTYPRASALDGPVKPAPPAMMISPPTANTTVQSRIILRSWL